MRFIILIILYNIVVVLGLSILSMRFIQQVVEQIKQELNVFQFSL